MDDVIVNKQSCCPEHTDGRREAVMEGTALDVGLACSDLRRDDSNFSFSGPFLKRGPLKFLTHQHMGE